jgi:drug/metabolite transporter (DMT)-like permease
MVKKGRVKGIQAAATSALFLGMAPIFGKLAILFGFAPLAVVAFRTVIAFMLLFGLTLLFQRQSLYIYPIGLTGCLLAGFFNGLGSILYYSALSRLDASVGQLLYSFYPLFMAFWLLMDRQSISRLTYLRLAISLPGVFLLIYAGQNHADWIGSCLMIGSALLYALHLLINQRVLYEVPAPTVALYTLLMMSVTVTVAYLLFDHRLPAQNMPWWPLLTLAVFTFASRVTLFQGVKHLGGMQTALLGLGELVVTVLLAHFWLGEHLSPIQWIGAGILVASLLLVGIDRLPPDKRHKSGWLAWLNPPQVTPTDVAWRS